MSCSDDCRTEDVGNKFLRSLWALLIGFLLFAFVAYLMLRNMGFKTDARVWGFAAFAGLLFYIAVVLSLRPGQSNACCCPA